MYVCMYVHTYIGHEWVGMCIYSTPLHQHDGYVQWHQLPYQHDISIALEYHGFTYITPNKPHVCGDYMKVSNRNGIQIYPVQVL